MCFPGFRRSWGRLTTHWRQRTRGSEPSPNSQDCTSYCLRARAFCRRQKDVQYCEFGDGSEPRTHRTVHPTVCGHERFAGETAHHEIQSLYANCTGALVGGALVGIGNLRPLVRPAFISEMKSRRFEKTRLEKRRLSVVARWAE